MNRNDILSTYDFQRKYLTLLVEDIPEENLGTQPTGMPNHAAWQLAHLVAVQDRLVQMAGGKSTLGEDWWQKYGRGSTPAPQGTPHLTKAELLQMLDERRAEYVKLFNSLNGDELAKKPSMPNPNPLFTCQGMFLTFIMLTHEATHLGQLAMWRKAMGMSEALSKMPRQ
jgi:hypothetical protein